MDATVADPLVGHVLDGRYRIESRIARGGMATVYVARDIRLDRVIALKVMHSHLASDEDFVARFIGEAKAAAALSHPNVVAVYDQRTDGEHVFLVMEYVPGRTLRDLLNERGRLGPREALEILQPMLAALGAAHRAGLVHRDVKPENVLLTDDGQIKVADFGLARAESASKMTKTGLIIGTVGYLAPEQVLSGNADIRSDVYAAGVLLYELMTGVLPHQGDTPLAIAYKHVNEAVPPPSHTLPGITPEIDLLVTRATSHDPGRRPQDANAFLAAVAEVHGGLPRDFDWRVEQSGRSQTSMLESAPPAPTQAPSGDGHTAVYDARTAPAEYLPRRSGGDKVVGALTGRYVLIAIGAVAAVILGWAVWYQVSGQYHHVPEKVVGMQLSAAEKKLRDDGLQVRVAEAVYDDHVQKGQVAKSNPPGGARVGDGAVVTLTPSKGRIPREVPDVGGKSQDEARQILEGKGFKVGDVSKDTSQTVDKDHVIRTSPVAGKKTSPDNPVNIVLSTGMSMPDLVGTNGEQAKNTLRSMGLDVKVDTQKDDSKPAGVVLSQNPRSGDGVSRGDQVNLVINEQKCDINLGPFGKYGCDNGDQNGDQQLPVPDVTGQNADDAKSTLEDAGFHVNVLGGGDNVRTQTPAGGTTSPRGSTVFLIT
ncbi:Stk1 family PASTA domain-containing Ser/Thr kinase [Actinomadura barringtoniae]|uniref:non-specific serine/threonine protein kinase n=1 Tax=Actinomadura barringtoniae TaxID=1427535 RepID=A0A939PHW6_9ACTN|nr:Stk1 family PASTA domain-containing Ser/Thr kinase [Actinomadura barringtoniae]MBO2452503.1 Stk1 family PASTA domain-containing Ser/Thr kinase [Actinomadura barringtoniae]